MLHLTYHWAGRLLKRLNKCRWLENVLPINCFCCWQSLNCNSFCSWRNGSSLVSAKLSELWNHRQKSWFCCYSPFSGRTAHLTCVILSGSLAPSFPSLRSGQRWQVFTKLIRREQFRQRILTANFLACLTADAQTCLWQPLPPQPSSEFTRSEVNGIHILFFPITIQTCSLFPLFRVQNACDGIQNRQELTHKQIAKRKKQSVRRCTSGGQCRQEPNSVFWFTLRRFLPFSLPQLS